MIPPTLTLAEATRRTWPVIVVGAGPAGALAARQIACRGIDVLLVDRATFPRAKVCGCCLSSAALAALETAGLSDVIHGSGAMPLERIRLAAGRRSAEVALTGGAALSRRSFDAALVTEAVRAGAAFLPGTWASLGALAAEKREVCLRHADEKITARAALVIAADGLGGGVLARGKIALSPPQLGSRVGIGTLWQDAPAFYRPGTIYMACGPRGYLGLVRLEDGHLDLAAAVDAAWLHAAGGPAAAARTLLREAGWPAPSPTCELPWQGTPALTRRPARVAAERLFALGDAAGYVEPFTGEGMAWALSAAIAVAPFAERAVHGWNPALARAWTRCFRQVVVRRQLVCRAAAFVLRRPWLVNSVVMTLARLPGLAQPFLRRLYAPLSLSP